MGNIVLADILIYSMYFMVNILWFVLSLIPCFSCLSVIRISPFANRLSQEVPPPIQRLRCLANYEALRFADPIAKLAETLVERMIKHSSTTGGKYIAVHLRFEEVVILSFIDFSCVQYPDFCFLFIVGVILQLTHFNLCMVILDMMAI
jgi:hypothetical protein